MFVSSSDVFMHRLSAYVIFWMDQNNVSTRRGRSVSRIYSKPNTEVVFHCIIILYGTGTSQLINHGVQLSYMEGCYSSRSDFLIYLNVAKSILLHSWTNNRLSLKGASNRGTEKLSLLFFRLSSQTFFTSTFSSLRRLSYILHWRRKWFVSSIPCPHSQTRVDSTPILNWWALNNESFNSNRT